MNNFTEKEHLKKNFFFLYLQRIFFMMKILTLAKIYLTRKKNQKLNSVSHTPDKLLNFSGSFLEERFSIFDLNIRLEV